MAQPCPQRDRWPAAVPGLRSATLTKEPDSGFHVRIEIDAGGHVGSAEAGGFGSEAVELRLAAEATIVALREATGGAVDLHLVGIKRVRAFDAHAALVSLSAQSDLGPRLVGAAPLDGNVAEGAALAVLSALENQAAPPRRPVEPRLVVPRTRPTALPRSS